MLELEVQRNELNLITLSKLTTKTWQLKDLKIIYLLIQKLLRNKMKEVKKQWKSIANEVTEIARRRMIRNDIKTDFRDSLKLHFAFKDDNYTIVKLTDHYVDKFKTREARWMIEGDISLFSINDALKSLITKMTEDVKPNSKVQIAMTDIESNRYYRTNFFGNDELEDELLQIFDMFTEYPDFNINNIIFQSFSIDLPSGAGGRANRIIDTANSRCILRIKNNDSLCLVKSIIAGLSITNIDKLREVFKDNLSKEEIDKLNFGKKIKSKINDGIFSTNELTYIKQNDKKSLLTILANAFHRIYEIPIRESGNNIEDVRIIEHKLQVNIEVYSLDKREIYSGYRCPFWPVKLYLLLSDNHYDVISMITAFIGKNVYYDKQKLKCYACGNKSKCDTKQKFHECDTCFKILYGTDCFDSHIINKRCIEHSYKCKKCHRIIKTKSRKINDHVCDEILCSNCNW